MAQQTAVDWLYNDLFPKKLDGFSDEEWSKIDKAFEQAKEMEKQQIKDAWVNSWQESMINPLDYKFYEPEAEQYYKETYGK